LAQNAAIAATVKAGLMLEIPKWGALLGAR